MSDETKFGPSVDTLATLAANAYRDRAASVSATADNLASDHDRWCAAARALIGALMAHWWPETAYEPRAPLDLAGLHDETLSGDTGVFLETYERHLKDGSGVAYALNRATAAVRARVEEPPEGELHYADLRHQRDALAAAIHEMSPPEDVFFITMDDRAHWDPKRQKRNGVALTATRRGNLKSIQLSAPNVPTALRELRRKIEGEAGDAPASPAAEARSADPDLEPWLTWGHLNAAHDAFKAEMEKRPNSDGWHAIGLAIMAAREKDRAYQAEGREYGLAPVFADTRVWPAHIIREYMDRARKLAEASGKPKEQALWDLLDADFKEPR